MGLNLRIAILVVTLILAFVIAKVLKKGTIPVKYSILWWIAVVILLLLAILPSIFTTVASWMGFETISNLVIGVFIVILFFITISLTIIVSNQKRKITLLIQEVSMLKEEIRRK